MDKDAIARQVREIETNANLIRNSSDVQDNEYRARLILDSVRKIKSELLKK